MRGSLIDIVPAVDRPGMSRWRAVSPAGTVVGTAALRPAFPAAAFGPTVSEAAFRPAVSESAIPAATELRLLVRPAWRRRGIGSRLLGAARLTAGRLVMDVTEGSPGEEFCRRHGFRHTGSGHTEVLTYDDVHQAWVGELVDAEHPGYRLLHWTGDLPGTPDVGELIRGPSRPGSAVLTAANREDHLAAYAVAVTGTLARARQYGPFVRPDHRGRRLGLWVNAALIRRLRQAHPHIDGIETVADADDRLLAARRHLGFRRHGRTRCYELP